MNIELLNELELKVKKIVEKCEALESENIKLKEEKSIVKERIEKLIKKINEYEEL